MNSTDDNEENLNENESKPNKTIVVSFIIFCLIILMCFFAFKSRRNSSKEVKEESASISTTESDILSIEDITKEIDSLYTSDQKVDIRSNVKDEELSRIQDSLSTVDGNTAILLDELNTIRAFISDKSTVNTILNSNYDLEDDKMFSTLISIKDSVKTYTIAGLSKTVNGLVSEAELEYDEYSQLKSELKGVIQYDSFDKEGYLSRINKVSHFVNKDELMGYYNDILNKIEEEKLNKDKELKDIKDALEESEKARQDAEKAKQDAEAEAEKAKKELEEATATTEEVTEVIKEVDTEDLENTEE